jgi:NAD(P)H-nitrite reductase large subunit
MLVCHCEVVNDEAIVEAINGGAGALDDVGDVCGAGTGCGGCHRMIERLLEAHGFREPLVA